MQVKNPTPLQLGTKVTARAPRRPEVALIARGTYALRPDAPLVVITDPLERRFLAADVFAEGDDDCAGAVLYPGDFADCKPRAEVMLRGSCHPSGGRAARECLVLFRAGAWSKSLLVFGRRAWSEAVLGTPSDPQPFTACPSTSLTRSAAPRSRRTRRAGLRTPEPPNVEYPEARIAFQAPSPCAGQLRAASPGLVAAEGEGGKDYGVACGPPRAVLRADFDWSHTSTRRPRTSRSTLPARRRGGLVPEPPPRCIRLLRHLPALRVRAFVKNDAGVFADVVLALDTLFVDLDEGVST